MRAGSCARTAKSAPGSVVTTPVALTLERMVPSRTGSAMTGRLGSGSASRGADRVQAESAARARQRRARHVSCGRLRHRSACAKASSSLLRVIRFGPIMAFREVVGHRRLLSLLARAIARDSLTPSLILSGPEGVGKRLTAIAIAQALNCLTARRWTLDDRRWTTPAACAFLPPHRARRACRRADHRAGRDRVHQNRAGSRRDRSRRSTGRSKDAGA